MLVFNEQNSVSNYFTRPRFANSFLRFLLTTRTAATRCKSTRATLSPRMIRGDKVLLTEKQLVTAVRVCDKLTFKTHSKPLPGNENDSLRASLKNLCRRLTPAGQFPGTFYLWNRFQILFYKFVKFFTMTSYQFKFILNLYHKPGRGLFSCLISWSGCSLFWWHCFPLGKVSNNTLST